ncbi:MAG: septum formation protein Maf [Eubacterium sp.]|nr:septum formation protein Maf [Eubacterium sp.]
MKIILASGSPRRKELLSRAGYTFEVCVSNADENVDPGNPGDMVEELARRKAMAVADEICASGRKDTVLVIGADTVVILDGEILGKPEDEEDAFNMLTRLSGRTHQVDTGVAGVVIRNGQIEWVTGFSEETDVTMRPVKDREIRDYIACGEPMDKAGAYGIQGRAAVFISSICGDYYNVVGLPLCAVVQMIMKAETLFQERI